jgi:hypothetical protein
MEMCYKVSIQAKDKENRFHITWQNMETEKKYGSMGSVKLFPIRNNQKFLQMFHGQGRFFQKAGP